jgi:hypothetical protein
MAAFGHVAQCTMPTPTALILEMDVAQARAPDMSAVLSRTALGASVQCQDPTSIPPVRRGRNTGDHFLSLSASVTVSTYADERDGGVVQGDDTALGVWRASVAYPGCARLLHFAPPQVDLHFFDRVAI